MIPFPVRVSKSILHLDQKGWERVLAGLERLHAFVVKEQKLAEARLRKSGGDEAIAIVVARRV